MTIIVNLYGGPGTGKSTNAARIFATLKDFGLDVEYVPEYIKNWVWENRKISQLDQYYFFGNQVRSELKLMGRVDFIVTDSPVALAGFYANLAGTESQKKAFPIMVMGYLADIEAMGHCNTHYFLKRVKPFNPNGRIHTERESIEIDSYQKTYLKDIVSIPYEETTGDEKGSAYIVSQVVSLFLNTKSGVRGEVKRNIGEYLRAGGAQG